MSMQGIALVIGAGSGIGRETAFTFAERGAKGVIFADFDEQSAKDAADDSTQFAISTEYRSIARFVDIRDKESVQRTVDDVVKQFGHIDYFVNSARIGPLKDRSTNPTNVQEFDELYHLNVKSLLVCNRVVSNVMLQQDEKFIQGRSGRKSVGRGVIVNLVSLASNRPLPLQVQHVVSKHAAMGAVEATALEIGPSGIRVIAVCPAWVDTPIMERNASSRLPELLENIKITIPSGRMSKAEEVARIVYFLCTPEASYVTGASWAVDSGVALVVARG